MVKEYLHYKLKIKDDFNLNKSEEHLLKSKNYYFNDDVDNMINEFIEINRNRGYEIDKSDIIVYRYYLPS